MGGHGGPGGPGAPGAPGGGHRHRTFWAKIYLGGQGGLTHRTDLDLRTQLAFRRKDPFGVPADPAARFPARAKGGTYIRRRGGQKGFIQVLVRVDTGFYA